MKKVILFQLGFLAIILIVWAQGPLGNLPDWISNYKLALNCILVAALGGVLYCLRAIYVAKGVKKNWDSDWETWYYLRPIASAISGLVAFIFLKSGLIVLEANQVSDAGSYGFLTLSFIAGLNVSNFTKKIEGIAKSTFGIENSKSTRSSE